MPTDINPQDYQDDVNRLARQQFLARYPTLHGASAAGVAEGALAVVDDAGITHYPAFQFEPRRGTVMDVVQQIYALLRDDYDFGWQMALWFDTANPFLTGEATPLQLLDAEPQAVLDAAKKEAAMFEGG